MALVVARSDITDTASAKASSGWHVCVSRSYCKWPAIIGIIIAVVACIAVFYCLFRFLSCCCCDCLSGGRYQRKRKHKYADLHSSPYNGYQQTANPAAYIGAPQQYAQFDVSGERGRGGEDSLPAMPTWKDSENGHVLEQEDSRSRHPGGSDVAMGKLEREREYEQHHPMLSHQAPDPVPQYAEMDANPSGDLGRAQGGYHQYGASYSQAAVPKPAYAPYSASAWSGSTRFEAEDGGQPPSALQAGRNQDGRSWRDV